MKVILIQGLLAPYRYPIFTELAKNPRWQFEVWFMGKKVKNRIWNETTLTQYRFNYRFLRGTTLDVGQKDVMPFWINTSIFRDLRLARPDVVVMMGWDSLTSFLVHLYCYLTDTKFVLYADSTKLEQSWRRLLTLPLVKLHVGTSDALIAGGSRSREYLESLGAKADNIHVSYNTVDVERYMIRTHVFQKVADQTRQRLGLVNKKIILYYGQLIERKGIDILLAAYQMVKAEHDDIALLIIGNGPKKKRLKRQIRDAGIKDALVRSNPGDDEICRYYSVASLFVLPSREDVWGLVVNEAMAAGLPVIVSDHAGCSADLVREGRQGYTFKSGNVAELAGKITKIIANDSLQEMMSNEARKRIKLFEPEVTIKEFKAAIVQARPAHVPELTFHYPDKPGLISVIIPVYQDAAGLARTLDSLHKQRGAVKVEIIVEHDARAEGSYGARNRALERARGEYLAFIDAGTVASPNWLAKGYRNLREYDYVGGPIDRQEDDSETVSSWARAFGIYREFAVEEFFHDRHFFPTTNLFVRRAAFEALGGFDARLKSSGDVEFGDRVYRSELFSQYYDATLQVLHPLRSYRGLMEKQARIATGHADLSTYYPHRFGHSRLNLPVAICQACLPPVWLFTKPAYQSLPKAEKYRVFLVTYHLNYLHQMNVIRRVLFPAR